MRPSRRDFHVVGGVRRIATPRMDRFRSDIPLTPLPGAFATRKWQRTQVREGEVGCLFDEIRNLVEPTERLHMDVQAGPQRGRMPKRCGRARASDSPVPGEGMGEPHAGERRHTDVAAGPQRSRTAKRRGRTARPVGEQYRQRTRQNVIDSDGTAILFCESLSGGTKLTRDSCVREKKPFVVLDAKLISESDAAAAIIRFVDENEIQVLNVAGPRLSGWPQGHAFALGVVGKLIGGNK